MIRNSHRCYSYPQKSVRTKGELFPPSASLFLLTHLQSLILIPPLPSLFLGFSFFVSYESYLKELLSFSATFIMYFSRFISVLPIVAGVASAIPYSKRAGTEDVTIYAYGTNISGLALYSGNNDGSYNPLISFFVI